MSAPLKPSLIAETRQTLVLATPIVVGQVSQMLMGVTDSIMIGRVGTVPLAASAFAGNVFTVFFILGIGLLVPVAVLVARERGARQPEACADLLRHGTVLAVVFSLVEIALLVALSFHLDRFGQPPEVVAECKAYFLIIAVSLLPALLFQVFRQFAESLGRPGMPMIIMLAGVALNVVLNWILIYGKLGAPAWGLTGAGWATLIARILIFVVLVVWLARDDAIREYWPKHWSLRVQAFRVREMMHIGIPASGQLLFESGAFSAAAIMIGWLGAVPLAAHQIALSCAALTFMFLLGLSSAASMRVSEALGAGEHARLRPIGFGALGFGTVLMSAFTLVFFFGASFIASRFVEDPAVVALAAKLLFVAAIFQVFDGGQVVGAGALRGLSDVKIPTLITFIAYWVIALPGGYLLGVRGPWGALGVWIALAAGLAFAAFFLALRFAFLTDERRVSRTAQR